MSRQASDWSIRKQCIGPRLYRVYETLGSKALYGLLEHLPYARFDCDSQIMVLVSRHGQRSIDGKSGKSVLQVQCLLMQADKSPNLKV